MDQIANMLTSLLNAQRIGKARVAVPYSGFKKDLLDFLQEKGKIAKVRLQKSPRTKLIVTLAYDKKTAAISGLKRLSSPGKRMYVKSDEIPYSYQGYGFIVVSTPEGLMDDKRARQKGQGGELICAVW